MHFESLVWGIVGVLAIATGIVVVFKFSTPARLRRRLKKTHSRIVSKSQRPMVKLSVTPPKDDDRNTG